MWPNQAWEGGWPGRKQHLEGKLHVLCKHSTATFSSKNNEAHNTNPKLAQLKDSSYFQFNVVLVSFAILSATRNLSKHLFLIHVTINGFWPPASALLPVPSHSGTQAEGTAPIWDFIAEVKSTSHHVLALQASGYSTSLLAVHEQQEAHSHQGKGWPLQEVKQLPVRIRKALQDTGNEQLKTKKQPMTMTQDAKRFSILKGIKA